jgi:hypothetical protein
MLYQNQRTTFGLLKEIMPKTSWLANHVRRKIYSLCVVMPRSTRSVRSIPNLPRISLACFRASPCESYPELVFLEDKDMRGWKYLPDKGCTIHFNPRLWPLVPVPAPNASAWRTVVIFSSKSSSPAIPATPLFLHPQTAG